MDSGGYIEQVEVEIIPRTDDNSMAPDSIFLALGQLSRNFSEDIGRDFNISDGMKDAITQAGFVNVVEERFKLPVGDWSSDPRYQEVGALMEGYFRTGIQGWLMRALTGYYQVRDFTYQVFLYTLATLSDSVSCSGQRRKSTIS